MNRELRLAYPSRLRTVERAFRIAVGRALVCTWVFSPGEVLDACLGFRAHEELRPIVLLGLFGADEVGRGPGGLLVTRHPYHYRYVVARRVREALPDLGRMEEMRDALACRRHVRRYGLAGGLRRVALHDLRGALAGGDQEKVAEVVQWVAGLEGLDGDTRSLAIGSEAGSAGRIAEAMIRLLEDPAHE